MNTAMSVVPTQTALAHAAGSGPQLTPAQRKLIRATFLGGASDKEAEVLLLVAERMGLDPFKKQIHFVSRSTKVGDRYEDRWAFQVSLQGWRAIAERNPNYEGLEDPIWEIDAKTKLPISCTIIAWRSDRNRPAKYTARFAEFVQTTRDGRPTKMWAEKPMLMLEKCAEVNALAKLFPEQQPSEVSALIAEAKVVHADFTPDLSPALPEPTKAGQAEIVKDFLAQIKTAEHPEALEEIGERIAATEIATEDQRFLRNAYKARTVEFERAKREAAAPPAEAAAALERERAPVSDEEVAAKVERGEA